MSREKIENFVGLPNSIDNKSVAEAIVKLCARLGVDSEILSKICNKPPRFFDQLERGIVHITYGDLWQILTNLFIRYKEEIKRSIKDTISSPWDLLRFVLISAAPGYAPAYTVTRSTNGIPGGTEMFIEKTILDHEYIDMTGQFIGQKMVVVAVRPKIHPGPKLKDERLRIRLGSPFLYWHSAEEFIYCLKGRVALFFAGIFGHQPQVILLEAGDSVWFPSTVLHKFRFLSDSREENLIIAAYHEPQGTPSVFPLAERLPKRERRRFQIPIGKLKELGERSGTLEPLRIGALIRTRRETLGWSLDKAANLLGITKPYIQRIEDGTLNPRMEMLHRIMRFFDMTWEDLFQGGTVMLTPRELMEEEEVTPEIEKEVSKRITQGGEADEELTKFNIQIQAAPYISRGQEHKGTQKFFTMRRLCFAPRSQLIPMVTEYKGVRGKYKKLPLGIHPCQEAVFVLDGRLRVILKDCDREKLAIETKYYRTIHEKEIDIDEAESITLNKGDFIYLDASKVYHAAVRESGASKTKVLVIQWRPYK